jgi:uncharacterized protein with beta-barrel porin domain
MDEVVVNMIGTQSLKGAFQIFVEVGYRLASRYRQLSGDMHLTPQTGIASEYLTQSSFVPVV